MTMTNAEYMAMQRNNKIEDLVKKAKHCASMTNDTWLVLDMPSTKAKIVLWRESTLQAEGIPVNEEDVIFRAETPGS